MRWLRLSLWILGGTLAALVLLVAAGFAFLQTQHGKDWLVATANGILAGEAKVETLTGSFPFHVRIARIALLDPSGEWARLEAARLDIAPWDLLRRRLTIGELSAKALDVARAPQSQSTSSSRQQSLALPKLPVNVDLQRLAIDSIRLAPGVLGEAVELTLQGNAKIEKKSAALSLALKRTDSPEGGMQASFGLEGSPPNLSTHVEIDDPQGLVLRKLLASGEPLPLSVTLHGDGPLADWRGQLKAAAGTAARLNAEIDIAQQANDRQTDKLRIVTAGTLAAAPPILPARFAPLLAPQVNFGVSVLDLSDGSILLDQMKLDTEILHAVGSGAYRSSSGALGFSLRLTLPDLAKLSDVVGQPLTGTADTTLSASGTAEKPELAATLHGQGIGANGNGASSIALQLAVTPTSLLSDPNARYSLTADGQLEGAMLNGNPIPAGLGDAVDLHLAARSDPAGQKLDLTALRVTDGSAVLTGTAAANRSQQKLTAAMRLALSQLGTFSDLAGQKLSGSGAIEAKLDSDATGAKFTATGAFDDLSVGIPAADALLGGHLGLDLAADRRADGAMALQNFSIDSRNLEASAHGKAAAELRSLEGKFEASLPNLAALRAAGLPVGGSLRLDGTVSGDLATPAIDAKLEATKVVWQRIAMDRLAAQLHGKGGPAPSASLDAQFAARNLKGTLRGRGTLEEDHRILAIRDLRLNAGGGTVDAKLRTALDSHLSNGTIAIRLPDLAPWSALAGTPLAGRIDGVLYLAARRSQDASLSLAAAKLRLTPSDGQPVSIDSLKATGKFSDLLRRPSGNATLDLHDAAAGGNRIASFHLGVQSIHTDRFGFETRLAGKIREPIELETAGDVALEKGAMTATVSRLTGKAAGYPIRLERPLTIASRGSDFSARDLALALGPGKLDGTVALQHGRADVKLAANALPLGLAGKFAGQNTIDGALDLRVALEGPAAQPRGHVAVGLRKFHLSADERATLAATLNADINPGRLDFKGDIDASNNKLARFAGAAPLQLGLQPASFALPTDRPIALRLQGDGQLRSFADLLPLGGAQRIAGDFHIDVNAGGTLATPEVSGALTLAQAHYEDLASGLVLDKADLALTGDHDRLVLQKLSATDGGKGTLSGRGMVVFAGAAPKIEADADLNQFRAVRRDDATATVSGTTHVAGPLTAPRVVGKFRVEDADLYVPDHLPPSDQKMSVTVINSATGQVLSAPTPPSTSHAAMAIPLDVTVDIPGRVFVRGRGLDSEWKGNLHVTGTSATPIIIGSLQIVHGTYQFLGKNLTLTQGTITFTGGEKIEPQLDFIATTSATGIAAQIEVTGTPDNPKITLSSQPPMPQDEILARILFGHSLAQVTPAEGIQLAQTAQSLTSGGPGALDRLRNKLGLDVLSLGSGASTSTGQGISSSSGGVGSTTLNAGKYVASGVYVGVQQSASGQSKSNVSVEVMPNVSVSSSVGPTGGNDIGLNWKLDY